MTRSIHYHEDAPVYSGPSSMDSAFPLLDIFASDPATWLTEASRQRFRQWNSASGSGSTHQSPRRPDHCGMDDGRRQDLERLLPPPPPTPRWLPAFGLDGPIGHRVEGSHLLAQPSFADLPCRIDLPAIGEERAMASGSYRLPPIRDVIDPELDLGFLSSDANERPSKRKRGMDPATEAVQDPHAVPGVPEKIEAILDTTITSNTEHDEAHSFNMPQTAGVIQWPAAGPSHLPAPPKASTSTAPTKKTAKRAKKDQPEVETSKNRPIYCELHHATYRGNSSFSRHKRTTPGHAEYKKPPECMYCHKKVSRRDALARHLSNSCRVVPRDILPGL